MAVAVILAVAWGVFAFGAVYPWAYWPLFAAAALIGARGLSSRRGRGPGWPVAISGALVVAAIGVQLLPIPSSLLMWLSPNADRLLRQLDLAYAAGVSSSHSVSIDPALTRLAFTGCAALMLYAIGLSRTLSARGMRTIAHGVIGIGAIVALAGIVQKSTGTYRIYGFWTPYDHPYQIFGPFVNKNHFSGWMIMALGLAGGVLCGQLTSAMEGVRDWRSRLLWWSSPDASRMMLVSGAIVIMSFAVVLTRSRSGYICLGLITLMTVATVIGRTSASERRVRGLVAGGVFTALAAAAIAWAGAGPVLARMHSEPALADRVIAWGAAIRIASDFSRVGAGLNSFATAMLFYQPASLTARWEFAHNDYLQLAAEGGWLVCVPAVLFMLATIVRGVRALRSTRNPRTQWMKVGALIGIAGIAAQELVDFSLQLSGVALLFATLVAFTLSDGGD